MLSLERLTALEKTHPNLSAVFNKHWDTKLSDYSPLLFKKAPKQMEPELENSFRKEWILYGKSKRQIDRLINQLGEIPVVQTCHHVTPTNGPTFLANDLISLAGIKEGDTYLVGASSGVAFSNTAWSGALSFGEIPLDLILEPDSKAYNQAAKAANDRKKDGTTENRVSLIPAKQRDALVFGTKITDYQLNLQNQFSGLLKGDYLPFVENGFYSVWASNFCSTVQSKLFPERDIFYFDINRVLSEYLVSILQSTLDHPILDSLFSNEMNQRIIDEFSDPVFFQGSYSGKKSQKVEGFQWRPNLLKGGRFGEVATDRERLIEMLSGHELCPGVFLQFLILHFINGLRCLGSFNQIEYLEDFRLKWKQFGSSWDFHLDQDCRSSLSTGRLIDKKGEIWPFDLALKGETLDLNDYLTKPMSHFWEPIASQLTANV